MTWTYNVPDGTPTNGPSLAAIALTFTSVAFVLVSVRTYLRTSLIKAAGWDDWVIIVAQLGAIGYTTTTVIQTKYGLGLQKLEDMPEENLYNFGLMQFIGAPFYVVGIWGFKISLLFSYIRFMTGHYRTACIVLATIITMAHIAFACVFIFMCNPVAKQWDPDLALVGTCIEDAVTFYLSFSSLTIIFDVATITLPFPVLLRSKIQRRKKIVLLGLFGLGIFVTIIQIIRIQTIKNLSNYLDSAEPIIWSIVETALGIIIACIPTIAPLVKFFSEKSRSGTGASSSRQPGSRYALQSWKNSRGGMQPLSSGGDRDVDIGRGPRLDDDSTEDILRPVGIMKKTDIKISRQNVNDSD